MQGGQRWITSAKAVSHHEFFQGLLVTLGNVAVTLNCEQDRDIPFLNGLGFLIKVAKLKFQ